MSLHRSRDFIRELPNTFLPNGFKLRRIAGHLAVVTLMLAGLLVTSTAPSAAAPKQKPECADKVDNDGDGFIDFKRKAGDPDCTSRQDDAEAAVLQCTDSEGNDGQFETPPPLPNATGRCDLATGVVSISECDPNYVDLNGIVADGCEYGPVSPTGPEECDGLDNDADGQVDEGVVPPEVPNGWVVCEGGVFVLRCSPGFSDANAVLSDGCEVQVA